MVHNVDMKNEQNRSCCSLHICILCPAHPLDHSHSCVQTMLIGKKFICVSKEGLELEETEEEEKAHEEEAARFNKFCTAVKDALGNRVKKVIVLNCITNLPCITGQFGWSSNMECITKAQALHDSSILLYMASKKMLELNPLNAIIKELKWKVARNKADKSVCDLTYLSSRLCCSLPALPLSLDKPTSFIKHIHHMISLSLDVDKDKEDSLAVGFNMGNPRVGFSHTIPVP